MRGVRLLEGSSSRPLYLRIQQILMDEIASGVYGPEGKLPSERELSERFQVSRMTARQALQNLQQRGIIFTQAGKGTYVRRAPVRQELERLTSFSEDMKGLGIHPHSQVLLAQVVPAHEFIADRLRIAAGSSVALLRRLRIANQQPIAIETAHISHARCPGLLAQHNFSHESLYSVLRNNYGIHLAYAEQTIRADIADDEECMLLQACGDAPTPILRIDRVTFDAADEPVEYVSSVYHGAYYEFRVLLRATRAQVVMPED